MLKYLIPLLFLQSCTPSPEIVKGSEKRVTLPNGKVGVVRVIILDGNEYYMAEVHGGITLCPKLPTKAEK